MLFTGPATRSMPVNAHGRDFVVGDLHGTKNLLDELLAHVCFDAGKDRLLSVGDLCDRGPHSRQCLELLREPWFHAVRGNHEEMLLAWTDLDRHEPLLENGGEWAFHTIFDPELLQRVRELPALLQIVDSGGDAQWQVMHTAWVPFDLLGQSDLLANIDHWNRTAPLFADNGFLWSRPLASMRRGDIAPPDLVPTWIGHQIVAAPIKLGPYRAIDCGGWKFSVGLASGGLVVARPDTGQCWMNSGTEILELGLEDVSPKAGVIPGLSHRIEVR